MKSVEIDRGKRLRDQPTTGHNRFHPDIPPLVTVDEGEEVVLATRDGVDGQCGPGTSEADMAKMEAGAISSPDRPGVREGRPPRRHAGDRVPRHRAAAARVHGDRSGARLPSRSVHDALPGPLADPRRLGDGAEASGRAHSWRA